VITMLTRIRIAWKLFKALKYERAGQFFCNRFNSEDNIYNMNNKTFLYKMDK
jgi:hypothetical protein